MRNLNTKTTKALLLGLALSMTPVFVTPAFAAKDADIDAQIAEQQRILNELNEKKRKVSSEEIRGQINDLESEIKKLSKKDSYDSKKAIESLSAQLTALREQLNEQAKTQELLVKTIEKLDRLVENRNRDYNDDYSYEKKRTVVSSRNTLVNPGPTGGEVSYTQDAKNAQNNSTMVFAYAPDQLYKIYCRVGYLTDIELHKGETVSFVGGGDTSAWAINSSTVAGTPHIYIKPVVDTSTTNVIINTDKRSYQLIVCTSDWYNPMVRWNYGQEEAAERRMQRAKDEQTITDRFGVTDMNKLHFNYKISVKGNSEYKPEMVFDDGEKTVIRFNKSQRKLPALFIREVGSRKVSLANFRNRGNAYIIDRVIDRAELRYSDSDVVSIVRGK